MDDDTTVARALDGQAVLVTGGGRGIGRAIAVALAANGAATAVLARSPNELDETVAIIAASGGTALRLVADVTNTAEIEAAVAAVEAALGPIRLLVNCAGTHRAVGAPWEVDPNLWWEDVSSSLRGSFLCSRMVLPNMIARRAGRIVNLSSGAALQPRAYSSGYAAAKAAILRLTDSFDLATRAHGVRMFAIHPGGVRTQLTDAIMASASGRAAYPSWQNLGWSPPDLAAQLVVRIATGELDPLAGRYLDATTDIDALLRRASAIESADLYTLRLRIMPSEGDVR